MKFFELFMVAGFLMFGFMYVVTYHSARDARLEESFEYESKKEKTY